MLDQIQVCAKEFDALRKHKLITNEVVIEINSY